MKTQAVIISSAGLKNIVLNKYNEKEDFVFIFGDQEFKMNNIFAEFISPIVSHLHQTDPTIRSINFGEHFKSNYDEFKKFTETIITSDTITNLQQISQGNTIELNEEQSLKLRFLSILLGNEELHSKLIKLFPIEKVTDNVQTQLKNIEYFYRFSQISPDFDLSDLLSSIASHFYEIDENDFLKIPRKIQYEIISHPNLQAKSEDSILDIVMNIIEKGSNSFHEKSNEIEDNMFLEQIEFTSLSLNKFRTFITKYDINEVSSTLWGKLVSCFFTNFERNNIANRIFVGGYDEYFQLIEKPNSEAKNGKPTIYPPVISSIDPSEILSYSIYGEHLVIVKKDHSIVAIGYNGDGRISSCLDKKMHKSLTKFVIKDKDGNHLIAHSAACCEFGTLYMLSKSGDNRCDKQLVLCDNKINGGKPVFLKIDDFQPVALFGGNYHSAAIGRRGEVIFINRFMVKKSPEAQIKKIHIPDDEKAISVACCNDSVFVLTSNGRVFSSPVDNKTDEVILKEVDELADKNVVCLSGVWQHCIAVTSDGKAFGWGTNNHGRLGLAEEINEVSSFTEIVSLGGYEIAEAYAGGFHSLFETKNGKVLACGDNYNGELLLNRKPSDFKVYSPQETTIDGVAGFCIAGASHSTVFIGGDPPPNMPNKRLKIHKKH